MVWRVVQRELQAVDNLNRREITYDFTLCALRTRHRDFRAPFSACPFGVAVTGAATSHFGGQLSIHGTYKDINFSAIQAHFSSQLRSI
ncbi:hypothetical protein M5689_007589 [Euphorbia peplus]|nr:hypothetical protein M5689_007589 [Euphorbia peplus]